MFYLQFTSVMISHCPKQWKWDNWTGGVNSGYIYNLKFPYGIINSNTIINSTWILCCQCKRVNFVELTQDPMANSWSQVPWTSVNELTQHWATRMPHKYSCAVGMMRNKNYVWYTSKQNRWKDFHLIFKITFRKHAHSKYNQNMERHQNSGEIL